jgi:hypothetical protein
MDLSAGGPDRLAAVGLVDALEMAVAKRVLD